MFSALSGLKNGVRLTAILKRLAQIDRALLSHDHALRDLYHKLRPLLAPPPEPPRKEIGFHTTLKTPAARVVNRQS